MTAEASLDVVGIGNALVDVISHETDEFIAEHGLVKNSMTLIDTERAEQLYAAMGPGIEASGGSAGNTMAGVASFGGRAAYMGRVADDQLGAVYAHDMSAQGVVFHNVPALDGPPTGRSLIVVTPDAHRTMNTYLGASAFFCPDDVGIDLVQGAQVTFLEGYLFDRPESKEAYWTASLHATEAGRKVALTLSDVFCVERHHDDFLPLVRERVDILFANEAEACALWGCDEVGASVERARAEVGVACITLSEKGSVVVSGPETYEIPAHPVEVVDTTGAGDLYAAGFLFGYTNGRPLPECGELGSLAAAEVISHIGARPQVSLASLLP
ncbi:MAG TPA: adenosine kinase [Acidimicrobiales bacterium]|nr:adenosine kinase [Acidimicrobiales bacterium]